MPSTDSNKTMIDTLLGKSVDLLLSWPKTVLTAFLIITAAVGSQAPNFSIDASPDTLLTRDNELYVQTQLVGQRFAPQEFLLVTFEPLNYPVISEQSFAALSRLSDELLALDRVESVRSILNVPVFSQSQNLLSGNVDLTQLTIEAGSFNLAALEEEFSGHPIYENLLVNEDLTAAALQVLFRSNPELSELNSQMTDLNVRYQQGNYSAEDEQEMKRLEAAVEPLQTELSQARTQEIEQIRQILQNYNTEADIHLGGVHVLAYQLIQIIVNDLVVFGSAMALGICLMLLVLFRALRWVLIPVVCCSISVLTTIGLFAMLGMKATVISSNFIALQLILTLAIVIHLIVQYRELANASDTKSDSEQNQRSLIRETLMRKVGPCFFAGITTSVGFGSLVFSGLQPVISFGWMMIIAMFVSIAVSLIVFPVVLELLAKKREKPELGFANAIVAGFSRFALKRTGIITVLSLALAAFSLSGILWLTVENSFINYFRASTQVHQELAYIDREFGGSTPLDLIYTPPQRPGNPDLIMSAETVQRLQLIQHRIGEHEATGRILSAVNLTDLARELNNNAPLTEYELTAVYWMMDETFREDLLGAFLDEETGQIRMNIWIQDLTEGLNRQQLLDDIRTDLAESGVDESDYQLTNLFVLYQDIMQQLYTSQILTMGIVFAVLLLTFLVIFRSFRVAIAAIVPNILSTLAILGTMGWLGIPLDLMTITIAAIAMGIAVDDTIHFIHRYLEERKQHSYADAIRRTHGSVGIAILYTSLLIVAGFSILAFSDFVPSILFGLLTALAMILALLTGLCLLPVLLKALVEPALAKR
ncbi:MAG: MMPL family transporter [Pseudohongiella sp.]|nr:MMPL family transporter [Pseudohongiella sp.]